MAAAPAERTWVVGSLTVRGPYRLPQPIGAPQGVKPLWGVHAVDAALEDEAEKTFPSAAAAQRFIDELVSGAPPVDPLADDPDEPARSRGAQRQRPEDIVGNRATLTKSHTRRPAGQGGPGAKGAKDPAAAPFNLKAVAEVLVEYGLNPFEEVARVMQARRPVRYPPGHEQAGQIVLDDDGNEVTEPVIHGIDRAKIGLELGKYIAPKLKAVEMKVEDKTKLTEAELDERIAAMLQRRADAPAQGDAGSDA